uniref:ATP synthase F0 subunit 8 n=1 Tax=Panagrolaimus sp. PS1159 TaxID=55785 RepID=A0AC35GMX8_9BILA
MDQRVKVLFDFAEHRNELYYFFGLLCLLGWLAFNLWVLRDYFCPWWFEQIYTETGLPQQKLELKKAEIIMRNRVSNAFSITTNIAVPNHQIRFNSISETRHNSLPQNVSSSTIRPQQHRSQSTVVMGF